MGAGEGGLDRPGADACPLVVRSIVLGSKALVRTLVVEALKDVQGMCVRVWEGQGEPFNGAVPDLLIVHADGDAADETPVAEQVSIVRRRWPNLRLILLIEGRADEARPRRFLTVHASVPMEIDVDSMIAVIRLVHAGFVIFPEAALRKSATWHSPRPTAVPNGTDREAARPCSATINGQR